MKARIWLAMLTVYIIWGSTYLAIHFAVLSLPPFLMAGVRFLIAGALMFAWRRSAGDPSPILTQWRSAAIVGGLLLVGGNGGLVWAEQFVPSGIASVLIATTPLWLILIDALRPGGQKPSLPTLAGVLMGFLGIMVLIGPGLIPNAQQEIHLAGALVIVLSSLSWALGSLYGRTADLPDSPLMGTSMEMLAGGAGLTLLGLLVGEPGRFNLAAVQKESLFGLLYLIVFGSLVAYSAYTWLLRNAPIPLVATYAYVNPLVAIFLGFLLAGEHLTGRTLVSALVIISSVAIINISQQRR